MKIVRHVAETASLFAAEMIDPKARMALFWAVLAASPLWLLTGLVGGFIGRGPAFTGTGLLAVAAFFAIWAAGVWAVERPRGQGA